jgi:uncharacterized membrane protein YozB (DUF420 family)
VSAAEPKAAGRRSRPGGRRGWWTAAGLAFFGLLPGLARLLVALAGGDPDAPPPSDPDASRLPLIVHGVAGTAFAVLGAFQFPTALRRSRRTWHRRTGRLLVPLGLIAAGSALWVTLFYPNLYDTGALLTAIRVTFGTAMVASIVIAYAAIKRRDIARHRAWMIRAYALALGVSTQIFTLGFGQAIFGDTELSTALLIAAGWVINLAIAEWVIRRRFRRAPGRRAGLVPAQKERTVPPTAVTVATQLDDEQ